MALLYLGIGRALFLGEQPAAAMHRHKTLEIALSLDLPFSYRTDSTPWRAVHSVAIAPGAFHEFRNDGGTSASILLVAEKRWNPMLKKGLFLKGPDASLDAFDLSGFRGFFRGLFTHEVDCSEVFETCERLVETIAGIRGYRGAVDERLLETLETIEQNLSRRLHSRELARNACLSEGRFLHLFAEQLGISFRQYVMHQRLLRATRSMLTGASATRAAVDAGFADSAHFTRTFVQLAGVRPSQLKSLRGRVQIYSCASPYCVRPTSGHPDGGPCLHCGLFTGHRSLL